MRSVSLLLLAASAGCVVDALPSEGRTCAGNAECADGLRCDPVSERCVQPQPFDAGPDQAPDLAADQAGDGSDASGTPPHLVCSAPVRAVSTPREGSRTSPSLRVDGLTLVAHETNTGWIEASRAALGESFVEWTESTALPGNHQDPTFLSDEQWIASISNSALGVRELALCDKTACEPLTLTDSDTSAAVAIDVDGPSVAGLPLLMVFNAKETELPGVGYLATPDDASLTSWTATRLSETALADVDDPAISSDGTLIVFGDNNNHDLWSIKREAITSPFSEPQRLSINDPDREDTEPELFTLPGGELELIYRRIEPGVVSIVYRTVCERQ
jgi:hypothetical protein